MLCSRCLLADGHVPLLRAEPLIGNSTDPPEPYNTTAVRSVVRWGTEAGSLTEETEQDHRLVYTYVYGPGERKKMGVMMAGTGWRSRVCTRAGQRACTATAPPWHQTYAVHACQPPVPTPLLGSAEQGNTTYQSPILHHVLLRDLKPGSTYFYSVGERGREGGPAAGASAACVACKLQWTGAL